MELLTVEEGAEVWTLRLDRGRGNALHTPGLLQLHRAVGRARRAGAPPLVLRAEGASFCTGLDLEFARAQDRSGMRELMAAFHLALHACFTYPAPTVAALHGHALAGGLLLALACDRRVLSLGEAKVGIHGITLGIAYPDVAVELARHRLRRATVERVLYRGELFGDREAVGLGLVDELVEPDRLVETAADWARARNGAAFAAHKRAVQRDAAARLARIEEDGMDRWLDRWFDPATQAALERARERRRQRSESRESSTTPRDDTTGRMGG